MTSAQPLETSDPMNESKDTLVLVADDEPSTLALVASHVRSKGFDVIEASDGDQAWQMAHDHLPDLIILDVMMPGMSGWEVCRKVREAVSLAHTGVIMLTGIGENLNEMTSPLYGADTYIDKPFEFSDLDEKIEETLERRRGGALGRPEAAEEEHEIDAGWGEPETMPGANGAPKPKRQRKIEKAPSTRPRAAKPAKAAKVAKEAGTATPARKASAKKARAASRTAGSRPTMKSPALPAKKAAPPAKKAPTAAKKGRTAAKKKKAAGARSKVKAAASAKAKPKAKAKAKAAVGKKKPAGARKKKKSR